MRIPTSGNTPQGRRSFLGSALAGLVVLRPGALAAAVAAESTAPSEAPAAAEPNWDLSWADQLKGKHKQVFDVGLLEHQPLLTVTNYLRAIKEVYGVEYPKVNAVVGIAMVNFPLNASDALYQKFPIGELWQVKDPATGEWAKRNIWMEAAVSEFPAMLRDDPAFQSAIPEMMKSASITSLRGRGAIFWQCNNALNGAAMRIAGATRQKFADVQRELRAGLIPGTKLVPAHTMAIALMQEKGCTYERL